MGQPKWMGPFAISDQARRELHDLTNLLQISLVLGFVANFVFVLNISKFIMITTWLAGLVLPLFPAWKIYWVLFCIHPLLGRYFESALPIPALVRCTFFLFLGDVLYHSRHDPDPEITTGVRIGLSAMVTLISGVYTCITTWGESERLKNPEWARRRVKYYPLCN